MYDPVLFQLKNQRINGEWGKGERTIEKGNWSFRLGASQCKQKYQAIRNRGYTNKACLRRLDVLVRAGGLSLYSPRLPV